MQVKHKVMQYADIFQDACEIVRTKGYLMTPESYAMFTEEYLLDADKREAEYGVDVVHVVSEANVTYAMLKDYDLSSFHAALKAIASRIEDFRSPGRVIYPMYVVLMVIMMARCINIKTSSEIAAFYNGYNLILQLLIPGIPSPSNFISEATINNVRSLVSKRDSERMFKELFGAIKSVTSELVTFNDAKYKDDREGLLHTLAFDGQEMRGTFVRGSKDRTEKGAITVTVYDCSSRSALSFKNESMKNHEKDAFIEMAESLDLRDKVIMCDALNSIQLVTDCITDRGAYYLMPIKHNAGNKELRIHIEAIFNREHRKTLKKTDVFKDHGRIEELTFEILPAELYLDPRIKNQHQNLRTLVKYTKRTNSITAESRYYISSIPFESGDDSRTLRQVRASILDYWFIESYHNVLDTSKLAQDRFQGCLPETLSLEASMNKVAVNIITAERNRMSLARRKKTPISYDETMSRMSRWSILKLFTTVFCNYMAKDPDSLLD